MSNYTQDQSKVEVKGLEARYYDFFMNLITLGIYPSFIERAISDLELKEGEKVIDFGAGTGRNACIMLKYLGKNGRITGVDIGHEMIVQFKKKCRYDNVDLLNQRIDEPINLKDDYDVVFTSFVLHGFVPERRKKIIENAFSLLKPGGRFAILDYNEFDIDNSSFLPRFLIRKAECPMAEEFIRTDIKAVLRKHGFKNFEEKTYFRKHLRLLKAYK